jgi:hypothetical protein
VYPQADGTAPGTQNNNKNPRAKQDKNAKNFTAKQNKQPNTSFSAACSAPANSSLAVRLFPPPNSVQPPISPRQNEKMHNKSKFWSLPTPPDTGISLLFETPKSPKKHVFRFVAFQGNHPRATRPTEVGP